MNAAARPEANRRVLLFIVLLAAILFLGSILFIISRAQT